MEIFIKDYKTVGRYGNIHKRLQADMEIFTEYANIYIHMISSNKFSELPIKESPSRMRLLQASESDFFYT